MSLAPSCRPSYLSNVLFPLLLLGLGLVVALTGTANAQAGQLDPDFAFAGRGIANFDGAFGRDIGIGGALQPDGRVVIVGAAYFSADDSDFGILRLTTDGELDTTLGGDGNVKVSFDLGGTFWDVARSVGIDSLGRIVVLGSAEVGSGQHNAALVRLLSDGTLDSTFGVSGRVLLSSGPLAQMAGVHGMALQPDGKILALVALTTGSPTLENDCAVVRLTADGSLDTNFAGTGFVQLDFGQPGTPSFDVCTAMKLLPDGRIVVVGTGYWPDLDDSVVARLMPNGSLDSSLGGTGKVRFHLGGDPTGIDAIDVDASGRMVIAGSVEGTGRDIAVARMLANGVLDPSFGGGLGVTYIGMNLGGALQDLVIGVSARPTGKIVVGGTVERGSANHDFLAFRLEEEGELDLGFGPGGTQTVAFDLGPDLLDDARILLVRPDGDILLAGSAARQNFVEEEVAFAQLLGKEGLFEDGFESGNLLVWSSSSP